MKKIISRIAVLSLCLGLAANLTSFADVYTANAPGSSSAQTQSQSQPQASYSGSVAVGTPNSSGPSGAKVVNSQGMVVYNPLNNIKGESEVGPGGVSGTSGSAVPASAGTQVQPQSKTNSGEGNAPAAVGVTVSTQSAQTVSSPASASAIGVNIKKPEISSEAAVLFDVTGNRMLYEKNSTKAMYPASTTKLMTALLMAEKLDQNDTITFSATAVKIESDAANAGMVAGDKMTVKDAMHAILLKSACEVANAAGEKISGSQSAFAALMNERAKQLGCTGTHFANASGLYDAQHYTTAYDMALITKAALANPIVKEALMTKSYKLPASKNRGQLTIENGNKMLPGGSEAVSGYIGGKTGYTSKSGNTLATGIVTDGTELIAVVFKSNSQHYKDSKALYSYGKSVLAAAGGNQAAASSQGSGWEQTGSGWKYRKSDGSYYTNAWLDLNGKTYFFGSDSIMCTGWKQFTNLAWYYFNPEDGAMVTNKWVGQNNKWYYLQSNGVMATNTTIDGKYQVDANGVYVKQVG